MNKKKVCLLGNFAVGKTSLVQRFVHSIFSEKYHTTIGVKIDRKTVEVNGKKVLLMVWDIHGQDDFQEIKPSYIMGSSGILLVVDGTRRDSLDMAVSLKRMVVETIGDTPFILLMNKADVKEQWEVETKELDHLRKLGWTILETSARTGEGVEEAFMQLTAKMLAELEE